MATIKMIKKYYQYYEKEGNEKNMFAVATFDDIGKCVVIVNHNPNKHIGKYVTQVVVVDSGKELLKRGSCRPCDNLTDAVDVAAEMIGNYDDMPNVYINVLPETKKSYTAYKKEFIEAVRLYNEEGIEPNYNLWSNDRIKAFIRYLQPDHTGKMFDVPSITTSCQCCASCAARREDPNSICASCYAWEQLDKYENQAKKLALATHFYTHYDVKPDQVPLFNALFVRFESFGEVSCLLQLWNYFTICEHNPKTQFALWSKNLNIVDRAIETYGKKPKNLIIIQSSRFVNVVDDPLYWFVDKIFTVFTEKYAKEYNIVINCGANDCNDCRICYTENNITHVNELKKNGR